MEFRDIDMNQHYTVEMIIARSVDGVEQLMAQSGLSHVELYYKRNIFAAKVGWCKLKPVLEAPGFSA